ncbi:hypothetical protein FB451DRAFT_1422129 [Mycena latifolia]|nr:hypothetical protein FB451DRAFT_1422129 [Mycena latifolia]
MRPKAPHSFPGPRQILPNADELKKPTWRQRRRRFKLIAASLYKNEINGKGRKLSSLMVTLHRILQTSLSKVFEREALRPLLLKDDQWKMLFGLGDILETFTQVTLQMSKSTTPTLPWVIPMYEKMLKHLTDTRDNVGILEPLRVAAAAGLTKLTTYYERHGELFLTISKVLHPSLGLSWFGKLAHDGKEPRENHARVLFTHAHEAYKKVYDDEKAAAARAHQPHPPRRTGSSSSFLDDVCMADDDDEALPSAVSEIDQFFAAFRTCGRGNHETPLLWWKVSPHCRNFQYLTFRHRNSRTIPPSRTDGP